MRVSVDHEACAGHMLCNDAAEAVFGSDDYGYSVVLPPDGLVSPEHEAAARRAVANCPERAIDVED